LTFWPIGGAEIGDCRASGGFAMAVAGFAMWFPYWIPYCVAKLPELLKRRQ
jgi:hypothetical protein